MAAHRIASLLKASPEGEGVHTSQSATLRQTAPARSAKRLTAEYSRNYEISASAIVPTCTTQGQHAANAVWSRVAIWRAIGRRATATRGCHAGCHAIGQIDEFASVPASTNCSISEEVVRASHGHASAPADALSPMLISEVTISLSKIASWRARQDSNLQPTPGLEGEIRVRQALADR
jgi:hypothetical protein